MLLLNSCTHIWVLVWFLWVYAQNEGFWVFLYSPFSRDHQTVVCAALLYFIFSLAMLCVLQIIHILINAYFPLLKKITVVILVSVGVKYYPIFSSVQSLSHVQLFATSWIAAHQASLSITNSRSSLTHVHRVSDAIQPSHPLSSPSPPAPNPSQHQSLFQWVNSSHEVAKVLDFQL